MTYSPTKVNPFTASQTVYNYLSPQKLLLPDGGYSLKHEGSSSPIFYLFNSEDKFTGYWMYLEIFDKNNKLIEIDFTKQYIINSINGKEEVKVKKGQRGVIDRFHVLITLYSQKLQEQIFIERYPTYPSPTTPPGTTLTGIVVSQSTNQPIKGVTIQQKTD